MANGRSLMMVTELSHKDSDELYGALGVMSGMLRGHWDKHDTPEWDIIAKPFQWDGAVLVSALVIYHHIPLVEVSRELRRRKYWIWLCTAPLPDNMPNALSIDIRAQAISSCFDPLKIFPKLFKRTLQLHFGPEKTFRKRLVMKGLKGHEENEELLQECGVASILYRK